MADSRLLPHGCTCEVALDSMEHRVNSACKLHGLKSGPALHVIPKPEGFNLRDKRSNKARDAAKWTAQDALYDASEKISSDGLPVETLFVCWKARNADGTTSEQFRAAGETDSIIATVERTKGSYMGWK